jgi:FkbM family methyltransferase
MKKMELLRIIVRIFYPYGSERTVLRGHNKGMRYIVKPGMGASYALGEYNMPFHFLAQKITDGMVVFDIGANRGQCTLFFSKQVGREGKVISFEPVTDLYNDMKKNIKINKIENVEMIKYAVSDSNGKNSFRYCEEKSTMGKLEGVEPTYENCSSPSITIDIMKLDNLHDEEYPSPDVLKIDVEGGGRAVLQGGEELLNDVSPDIYFELHGPEEQKAVRDELLERGYTVETIEGKKITEPVNNWYSPLWCYKN